jgi:hypothetical protein
LAINLSTPCTEDTMLTITTEGGQYRSLPQAVRRIPPTKGNRPVHTSTLTRWITKGVRKADGVVIKLRARRFPGGWKVADQAIDEFLDELTRAALAQTEPAAAPAPAISPRRQRELDRVDAELDAAGIVSGPTRSPRPKRSPKRRTAAGR